MVRETRYLWVGNLPDKVTEERISQHFERYGKIQSVKILAESKNDKPCATVAFMDIKSASKAHNTENKVDGVPVATEYFEPNATGTVTITRTTDGDTAQRGPAPSTSGASFPPTPSGKSAGRASTSGAPFPGRSDSSEADEPRTHERTDYNYEAGRRQNSYDENDYEQRGRTKQRFPQTQVGRTNYTQRQQYEGREGRGQFESSSSLERSNSATGNGGVTVSSAVTRTTKPQWGNRSPARSSDSLPRSSRHGRRSTSRSPPGSRSSSGSSSSRSSSPSSPSRSPSSSKASRDHGVGGGTPTTSMSSVVTKKEPSVPANQNSENKSGERQDLGIKIRGLPMRSSDTSLRDGLLHEYKKHGKVTSVNVFGSGDNRYAIVSFKRPQESQKALEASQNKMFFRTRIIVEPHEGYEVEDDDFEPPEAKLDEYHPKATRTLFVGNLEKEISAPSLRDTFKPFGEIIDIDIKKQGAVSAYAFVQYSDISSVVKALHKMDGEHIGNNRIKLGFGKSMPMNCVWLDNVVNSVTEKYLVRTFGRYGPVSHSVIDTVKGRALIYFDNMDFAQIAVNEMRGRIIGGKKIQIDFASRDCQTAFFQKMEETSQLRPGERPDERWAARLSRSGSTPTTFKHHPGFEEPEFDAKTPHTSKTYTFPNATPNSARGRAAFPQRGSRTNNVRGQRITSSRSSNASGTYYENYEEYRRSGSLRSFEEYSEGANFLEDSFEQELRDYGYRQQERQNLGDGSSPQRRNSDIRRVSPFSRGSRHTSPAHERVAGERYEEYPNDRYPERFRDSDSQSGEKESVRSFHSQRSSERRVYRDRQFEEQFTERYHDDKRPARGFSPASSEYSHKSRSPGRYRTSRSPSPVGKHKIKDRLGSPVRDNYQFKGTPSRHGSPVDYDYKDTKSWDGKSQKSKEEGPKVRDIRERCDSEERTSITKLMGKSIATFGELKPRKNKLESEEDLSDTDKSKKLEGVIVKRRSIDEWDKTDGTRRDKQRARSMSQSGSRIRLNDIDHTPSSQPSQDSAGSVHNTTADPPRPKIGSAVTKPKKSKEKKRHKDKRKRPEKDKEVPYDPWDRMSGKSDSEDSSASSSSSLESDGEMIVERGSGTGSHSSSDVHLLQNKRQHLLNELKQLEDKPGLENISDDEATKKAKRARLEDMFDLSGRSPRVEALLKASGKSTALEQARFKMELARKYQHNARMESKSDKKILPPTDVNSKIDVDEDYHDSGAEKSPKEISKDSVPKKRRKVEGPNATLPVRNLKLKGDEMFSGDEGDSHKHKHNDKSENDHSEKFRHGKLPPMQIRLEADGSGELPRDPRRAVKNIVSVYYHREGADGDSTNANNKWEVPLTLPLPKWASHHQWSTPAPTPKQSPKASSVTVTNPPQTPVAPESAPQEAIAAANSSRITSPPFSPGSKPYSPQDSPILKNSDSPAEGKEDKDRQVPPPPPLLPPLPPPSDSDNKENTKAGDLNLTSPSQKVDSDSELSDTGSPSRNSEAKSLEERLRAFDAMMMAGTKATPPPPPSATSSDHYREKYKVRKRVDPSVTNSVISSNFNLSQIRSEPSHIVKSIMLKKSILDQDSKRLEKINQKFDPATDGVVPEDGRVFNYIKTDMPPPLTSTPYSLSSMSSPSSVPPASAPPFHSTPSTGILLGTGTSESLSPLSSTLTISTSVPCNMTAVQPGSVPTTPTSGPRSAPPGLCSDSPLLGLHSPPAKLAETSPRPGILVHRQSTEQNRVGSTSGSPPAQESRRDSISSVSSDTPHINTTPPHPVSILKKQESAESTSSSSHSSTPSTPHTPLNKTPALVSGPATPVAKEAPVSLTSNSTPNSSQPKRDTSTSSNLPSSSSGVKRKLEDNNKTAAVSKSETKLDKPKGAISRNDSTKSDKSDSKSEEPDAKRAKTSSSSSSSKEHKKSDLTSSSSTKSSHKDTKKSSSSSSAKHTSKSPEKKTDKKDSSKSDDKSKHEKSNHSKTKLDQDKDSESGKSSEPSKAEGEDKEASCKSRDSKESKDSKESSSSVSTSTLHSKHKSDKSSSKDSQDKVEKKESKSSSSTSSKDKSKSKTANDIKQNRTVTSQTVSETIRPDMSRMEIKSETKTKSETDKHKSDKHTDKHTDKHKHSSSSSTEKHDRVRSDSADRSKKSESKEKSSSSSSNSNKVEKKTDKDKHVSSKDKSSDKSRSKVDDKKQEERKKQVDRKEKDKSQKDEKSEEKVNNDKKKPSKDKEDRKEKDDRKDKEDRKDRDKEREKDKEKDKDKDKEREREEREKAAKEEEKNLFNFKFEEDMMFPSMYDMVKARRKARGQKDDDSQRKVEENKKKSFDRLQERRRKSSKAQKSDDRDSSAHSDEDSLSSPVRETPKAKKKKDVKPKKNAWIMDSSSEEEDDKIEKKKKTPVKISSKPRVETSMSMESEDIEDLDLKPKKKGKKKAKQMSIPSDTEEDEKQVVINSKEKETTECQKLEMVPPGQRYKMIFSSDDDEIDDRRSIFSKFANKKENIIKKETFPEFSDELSDENELPIIRPKSKKKPIRKKLISESGEDDIAEIPLKVSTPKPTKTCSKEVKTPKPKEKKVEQKVTVKEEEREEPPKTLNSSINKVKKAKHKDKKKPIEESKNEDQESKKDYDEVFVKDIKDKKHKKDRKEKEKKPVEDPPEDKSDDRPMPTLTNESPCELKPPLSMPDLDLNLSNFSYEFDSSQDNNIDELLLHKEPSVAIREVPKVDEKEKSTVLKSREEDDKKDRRKEHKSKKEKNLINESRELDVDIKREDDDKVRKDGLKKKKLKKKKKILTDENEEKRTYLDKDDLHNKLTESSIWRGNRDNIFDMMNRKEEHFNVTREAEVMHLSSMKNELKSPKQEVKSPQLDMKSHYENIKSPLAEVKQAVLDLGSPKHVISETVYEGDESEKGMKEQNEIKQELKTSPICSDEESKDELMIKPPSIEEILAKEAAEKAEKERERSAARREITEKETEAAVAAVEQLLQSDCHPVPERQTTSIVDLPDDSFTQVEEEEKEVSMKSDMSEEEKAVLALAEIAEQQEQEPVVNKPVTPGLIPPPILPEEEDSLPESSLQIAEDSDEMPDSVDSCKTEPEPVPPKVEEPEPEVLEMSFKSPKKGKSKKAKRKSEEYVPPEEPKEEIKEEEEEKPAAENSEREPSVNEVELMAAICSILPGEETTSPPAPPTPQATSADSSMVEETIKSPLKSPLRDDSDVSNVKSPTLPPTPDCKSEKSVKSPDVSLSPLKSPLRDDSEPLPGSRTPRKSLDEPLPGSRTPARRSIDEPGNRTPARSFDEALPGSRTPGRRSIDEPLPGSRTPGRRSIDETISGSRTPRRSLDEGLPGNRTPARSVDDSSKVFDKENDKDDIVKEVKQEESQEPETAVEAPVKPLPSVKPLPEMNLVSEIPDPCHQPDDDGDDPIDEIEDPDVNQPRTPQAETPEKKEETPRKGRKAKKGHGDDNNEEEPTPVRSSPRSRGRLDLNENSQERFSSRGRKIIPKERDDDLTGFSGQTRKTRQQTMAESPRGRGRRNASLPLEEGVKPRRGARRGSLKQNEDQEGEKEEEEPQEEETEEVGIARNRGALRRRKGGSRGRQGRGGDHHLDDSKEEEESKDSYDDKYDTSGDVDLDVQVDSPRLRRARRAKGKRADTGSMSPRTRSSEGSISPRGKALDGGSTSPKASELSRPFVKLEKLRFPEIKNDDKKDDDTKETTAGSTTASSRFSFKGFGSRIRTTSDEKSEGSKTGKDLYEWEDDDEKPPPVSLHTQRPRNKRKVGEWESSRKPLAVEEITQDSTTFLEKAEEKKVEEAKEEEKKVENIEEKKPIIEKKPIEKPIIEKKVEEKPLVKEKKPDLNQKHEEKLPEVKPPEPKVEEKRIEEKKEPKKLPPDVPDINDTFIPASMSGSTSTDDFQNHSSMTPLNILVPTSVGEMPRITVPPDSRPQSGRNSPSESLHIVPTKLEFKKEKEEAPKGLIGSPGRVSDRNTPLSNLDRVIDDVARGNFSLAGESPVSPSPSVATKTRQSRSRSREDVHSPRSSISGGVPPAVNSTSPTMASPPTQAMPHLHGAPQVAFPPEMNKMMGHHPAAPSHGAQHPHHQKGVVPQHFPDSKQSPMMQGMQRMPQPHIGAPTSVIQSSHPSNAPPTTAAGPMPQQGHRPGYPPVSSANIPGSSVHVGVVSDAYNIGQRENSPQGQQVIEIVPNPNLRSPTRSEPEKHSEGIQGHHPPQGHHQGHHQPPQGHHQGQGHVGHKGHGPPPPQGPHGQQPQGVKENATAKGHGVQTGPHPPHGAAMHPHYPPHSQHYATPGVMVSQGPTTTVSPSTQTSELRAALARGRGDVTKMVQQQERKQPQQPPPPQPQAIMGLRPPTPHQQERQSPIMGHPRMGYPFPDMPRQGARMEAKTSPGADAKVPPTAPVFAGELPRGPGSAFSQPDLRMPHPDNRPGSLPPPDGRGLPSQMYPGEVRFHHPSLAYPPHMVRVDPRMMFPQHQFSPELFAAHQGAPSPHMMPGIVPPQQQFMPGHPQGSPLEGHPALERPPSAARPPSAQASPAAPSPRATPTPVSTPLSSPMLPHPAMPRTIPHMHMPPLPEDNLYHILQRFPVMWQGTLSLKNESALVQMHALSGSQGLIKNALRQEQSGGGILRIVQRMRLEPQQLDGVNKKMLNDDEFSMLLALPCGRDHIDLGQQIKNLRSGLINYLSSKQAAGIINVAAPGTDPSSAPQAAYVVHIFPPCEFSQTNLRQIAPDLLQSLGDMAHMLIVIATV